LYSFNKLNSGEQSRSGLPQAAVTSCRGFQLQLKIRSPFCSTLADTPFHTKTSLLLLTENPADYTKFNVPSHLVDGGEVIIFNSLRSTQQSRQ